MSSLVLAPLIVCGLVMVLLVGVLGYVVVRRFRQAGSEQGREQLFAQARQWLSAQRAILLPWRDEALTDVAAAYSFQWNEFVITHATGQIQSIAHSRPIVAFYGLRGPGLSCTFATTSAHQWQLETRSGTIAIMIDDRLWGHCQGGRLFDAAGNMIGEAPILDGVRDQWSDVTLHGRVIGAVFNQHEFRTAPDKAPLLRPAAGITADDTLWLLTVAFVDVSYTALKRSNTAGTGPIM